MTRSPFIIAAAVVSILACQAAGAAAQTDPKPGRELDLSTTIEAVRDDNPQAGGSLPGDAPLPAGEVSLGVTPIGRFRITRERWQLGVTGSSNLRYYPDLKEVLGTSHSVGAGFSAQFGRRTTVFFNQAVTYSPAYLYGLFASVSAPAPGDVIPGGPDYVSKYQGSYSYATTATLTQGLGLRDRLFFKYDLQDAKVQVSSLDITPLKTYDIGGTYIHQVSRDFGLRLGYTYRTAATSALARSVEHNIDIGFDYLRPLSRTRRTTMGFNVGSAVGSAPISGYYGSGKQRYDLLADLSLTHQMGRTWSVRGAYRRSTEFVAALGTPVYGNAVTLSTQGYIARQVDLTVLAAYSKGSSLSSTDVARFSTYTSNVRLRFILAKSCTANLEYVHYFYNIDEGLQLNPGVAGDLNRNTLRASLTLALSQRRR